MTKELVEEKAAEAPTAKNSVSKVEQELVEKAEISVTNSTNSSKSTTQVKNGMTQELVEEKVAQPSKGKNSVTKVQEDEVKKAEIPVATSKNSSESTKQVKNGITQDLDEVKVVEPTSGKKSVAKVQEDQVKKAKIAVTTPKKSSKSTTQVKKGVTQELVEEKVSGSTTGKNIASKVKEDQVEKVEKLLSTSVNSSTSTIEEKNGMTQELVEEKVPEPTTEKNIVSKVQEEEVEKVENPLTTSANSKQSTTQVKNKSQVVEQKGGDKKIEASKCSGVPNATSEIPESTKDQNKLVKKSSKPSSTVIATPKAGQRMKKKKIKSRLFQETISFSAYKRAISEEQEARKRRRELKAKQAEMPPMKETTNLRKSTKRPRNEVQTDVAKRPKKTGLSARPPFSTSPLRSH